MVNKCVSSQLKGKGAGLWFDIKSEDLSSDFTFIPWSLTGPVDLCALFKLTLRPLRY